MSDFQAALENFTHAAELEKKENYALAGQAITLHAMGQTQAAQDLWRSLLDKDERHRNSAWLAREYGWTEPLLQEAERLQSSL